MDTKRTILAVALSFAILMGWQFLAEHMGWVKPQPAQQGQEERQAAPKPAAPSDFPATKPLPAFAPSPGKEVVVETPLYRAVLYSGGGILNEFALKQYRASIQKDAPYMAMISPAAAATAPMGVLLDGAPSWSMGAWRLDGSDLSLKGSESAVLRFTGDINGVRITRELRFSADSYAIQEKTTLASDTPRNVRLAFTMGAGNLEEGDNQYNKTRIAYFRNNSFKEEDSESTLQKGIAIEGPIEWASVLSNYFLALASPQDSSVSLRAKLQDKVFRLALERGDLSVTPGQETTYGCVYYIGPKTQSLLAGLPNNMEQAVNYGFFSVIARPLMLGLDFFYSYVGNYGTAIILLTVLIKIILWPLSYKSYKSMEQMKKLQPQMNKLKEKYGSDKERLNKEMMQLYKTYKVNPAGGCLPILVQIPIFFGLYQGLMSATALRHAPFITHLPFTDLVWLADLSAKDPFYITPLIMGGTMFLQQWMTPAAGDPTQQKMMLLMPVVFTFLFLNFPSGLVLYWLTNNIISIAQQWWQLRRA